MFVLYLGAFFMVPVGARSLCNKATVLRAVTTGNSIFSAVTFVFVMKHQYCVVDAELDPVGVSQEHAAS